MYEYRYGGKRGAKQELTLSDDMLVLRARGNRSPRLAGRASSINIVESLSPVARYRDLNVEVLRVHDAMRASSRDSVLAQLKSDRGFDFAGHCLCDPVTGRPVVYTEKAFIRFNPGVTAAAKNRLLARQKLGVKRELNYISDAYLLEATEEVGRSIFDMTSELLETSDDVALCHPELIRERHCKTAFPPQWHLRETMYEGNLVSAHAHVEAAWSFSTGAGTTIAVIDDGVDIDHVEFRASGGIVAPREMSTGTSNARPRFPDDNHGTACAGVACASGADGASGVAPDAALMPIRLSSGLGSQEEADAFAWAAQNGADVISCSWGPRDGDWSDPNDPLHNQPVALPDSTRLALEFAATQGRGGNGCVICWAAGNGNESVDLDGYASSNHVMAVGACNDRNRRSVYSDFGGALWCMFPSSDFNSPQTKGIWTTDRIGMNGYNPGESQLGHPAGDYTNDFGGTSSACPGAAGAVALMLATEPQLGLGDVWDIIRDTCEKIDTVNGEYDDATGHSELYGYGRVHCLNAVLAAQTA